MKQTISLEKYLSLGGKLEKLNLEKTKVIYTEKLKNEKILSIKKGGKNKNGDQLYYVEFLNSINSNKDYGSFWIETEVTFGLSKCFI